MKREVVLTATAQQQMNVAADRYAEENPDIAANWFNGLIARLNSLSDNPEKYAVSRESKFLPVELRQMLYRREYGSPIASCSSSGSSESWSVKSAMWRCRISPPKICCSISFVQ